MLLNAFLIADAASAPPDGKFYIHGGGLTRLTVPALPFSIPQLGAFVRLEIEAEEIGQTREFSFALIDPDGVEVGPFPRFMAALPEPPPGAPDLEDGEQRFAVLAMNIAGIVVGRRGLHRFEFRVDGDVLGAMPLPVAVLTPEQLNAATAPAQPPSSAPMQRPPSQSRKPLPPPRKRRR